MRVQRKWKRIFNRKITKPKQTQNPIKPMEYSEYYTHCLSPLDSLSGGAFSTYFAFFMHSLISLLFFPFGARVNGIFIRFYLCCDDDCVTCHIQIPKHTYEQIVKVDRKKSTSILSWAHSDERAIILMYATYVYVCLRGEWVRKNEPSINNLPLFFHSSERYIWSILSFFQVMSYIFLTLNHSTFFFSVYERE